MSSDLKLCPFCGGVPELCDGDIVQCLACDVRRYPPEAWNEREPDRLVDAEYMRMKALMEKYKAVLEMLSKKEIGTWYSTAGEAGYWAGWDDAEYAIKKALETEE